MKTKKIKKKLTLNKVSIAHLDNNKINQVKGGLTITLTTIEETIPPTVFPPQCTASDIATQCPD